jgi:phospholipid/cholesterol/gamma-HCH transport system substrate-binding protein
MAAMTSAFDQAGTTLANADTTLESLDGAVSGVDDLVRTDGAATLGTLRSTVTRLDDLVDALGTEARAVLALYGDTATQATARLTELQSSIVGFDRAVDGATAALASVDEAATSFDTLVEGDGTELVSEARTTRASLLASFGAIETVATDDLPAIVSDIRQTLVTDNGTIDRVSQDVTRFTGDLAPVAAEAGAAIEAATTTFRDASAALDRLQPAIASSERTLAAAEGAFTGAEQVIQDDLAPATADLRLAAERMTVAVEAISADLPAITAEVKATLAAVTATIGRIDGVVRQSAGPVGQFAAQGLPQLTRFTQDAQALVLRLDRIAAQLERDPARFLLSTPAPDFRR